MNRQHESELFHAPLVAVSGEREATSTLPVARALLSRFGSRGAGSTVLRPAEPPIRGRIRPGRAGLAAPALRQGSRKAAPGFDRKS